MIFYCTGLQDVTIAGKWVRGIQGLSVLFPTTECESIKNLDLKKERYNKREYILNEIPLGTMSFNSKQGS